MQLPPTMRLLPITQKQRPPFLHHFHRTNAGVFIVTPSFCILSTFTNVNRKFIWDLETAGLCMVWSLHRASVLNSLNVVLLKLMSIESVMPSNHLILCCHLLLLPSIFPSIRIFSTELALHIRWYVGSILFVTGLEAPLAPKTGAVCKTSLCAECLACIWSLVCDSSLSATP